MFKGIETKWYKYILWNYLEKKITRGNVADVQIRQYDVF